MTSSMSERDDQLDEEITSPEDALGDPSESMIEDGYSPPERPLGLDAYGTTAAEEAAGETLDQRLAQEEPDVDERRLVDEQADVGGEVGRQRAGRLVDPDGGAEFDTEKDLVARDVGIDGAAASSEEAAVHIVDGEEQGL